MEKGEREDAKMSKKMPTSPFDSSSDDASNQVPSNSQDYFNNRPPQPTSNPYRLYPNRPSETTSNPYRLYHNRPSETTSNPYRLYHNRPPQTTSYEYSQFNNQQVQSSSASTDDPNHVRFINHLQFNSRPQQTTSNDYRQYHTVHTDLAASTDLVRNLQLSRMCGCVACHIFYCNTVVRHNALRGQEGGVITLEVGIENRGDRRSNSFRYFTNRRVNHYLMVILIINFNIVLLVMSLLFHGRI
ncbi:uncharacterized protein LOC113020261 isoform X2 [Astatotilapia calliptera]|nr:uncharacterized protein LOC113020261 isoform X2 [Astatotilapia calliptera]